MKFKNEIGATTLEATITLIPFFILVLGIIQVCIVAYYSFALQYVAFKALRSSSVYADSPDPSQTKFEYISNTVKQNLQPFGIKSDNLTINLCDGIVDNCNNQVSGTVGNFVTLRLKSSVPSVVLISFPPVESTAITKNEPY